MKRKQFDTLVIDVMEKEQYDLPLHSHTYYEMVYVIKGSGEHYLNNNVFNYKVGDLFLLSPGDNHYIIFNKKSKLVFIKFTDAYFQDNKHLSPDSFSINSPLDIMQNQILKEEKLVFDEPCKSILRKTVENILSYNSRIDVAFSPLIFFQILSIFGLVQEAAKANNLSIDEGVSTNGMISYINQNIYNPQKIRIKAIAGHFNIAQNYFSNYFKRNFEVSFKEYIDDYRIKLIEKRLELKENSIKQIANEFGFTDESHLTNYFKKHRNISPSQYASTLKKYN
ncbi:AraC-type DNA-binding protein [Chishuiella changwenlii]|uniref:AraC-type DNA-binding protein n=1 Tax=Chishuiella changwenlii TaxID=1434701 RepID=A0A1M7CK57_9FLAO|nr:AraC family transcriptional regulator [Chishuiella changwenlii]GGE96857.1 transcription regulator [Chishuiella changwenlii]SHL67652.1 AraC-type DNA-binding protein [Chishuiella changwenlii]